MGGEFLILLIIAILLFALGLLGTVIPFLPDTPLIWLGVLIFVLFNNFQKISILSFGLITFLMIFTLVFDYLTRLYCAKKLGAGKWGMAGAVLGTIIGLLTGGLVGLLVGPILGAALGELISGKSYHQAIKSGLGTIIGFFAGTLVKFVIGLVMIGIFIWQIF